jgi:hypothetical protein
MKLGFPARRLVDVGNSSKVPARWLAGVKDSGEIQRGSSSYIERERELGRCCTRQEEKGE